jgi:hypothetical protein
MGVSHSYAQGQSAFVLSDEEFPMTMQVGMIGTNGVLIASDTRVVNDVTTGPREQSYLPRQTVDASRKIIINHKRGIAISPRKRHRYSAARCCIYYFGIEG